MKRTSPLTLIAAIGFALSPMDAALAAASPPAPNEYRFSVREPMNLILQSALSPDGKSVIFTWDEDLWLMPSAGGEARRITRHQSGESFPVFSPDGSELAFSSYREDGVPQVFVMPVSGGHSRQLTFNSEGATPTAWFPDGKSLLISAVRDLTPYSGDKPALRFFRIDAVKRGPEELLFDDEGKDGSLSPDGSRLLFTREDHEPFRIGYRGSLTPQVWMYDLRSRAFTLILKSETGYRSPRWRPDGRGFLCLDGAEGAYNLAECDLATRKVTAITHGKEDNADALTLSADGSTALFNLGFDLYRYDTAAGTPPSKVTAFNLADRASKSAVRRVLGEATEAVRSGDGLEWFFAAGGDLWVMNTTHDDPPAITKKPAQETSPVLSKDGKKLWFIRDNGAGCDIFVAEPKDPERYWWENDTFTERAITSDGLPKSALKLSPDALALAYVRGLGDLVVRDLESGSERVLTSGFSAPQFDWSPDGRWIAYSTDDNNSNSDIFIVPSDGSSAAVNVSRYPDNDFAPSFSPDGKCLAWVQENSEDYSIAHLWLTRELDQRSSRDDNLESAGEKMKEARGAKKPVEESPDEESATEETTEESTDDTSVTRIDFKDIARRVRLTPSPAGESTTVLAWSEDGRSVVFSGETGLVSIDITTESPEPKILTEETFTSLQTLDKDKGYAGLVKGVPATLTDSTLTQHPFNARQEYDAAGRRRAGFLRCWRLMRDNFYDAALNNRDWNAVRAKYEEAATHAVDTATFDRVVNMMLGELNGSHLGYWSRTAEQQTDDAEWKPETANLGLRFDKDFAGPGLRVSEVIKDGPADLARSSLNAGDLVLTIDGVPVDRGIDLTTLLNGPLDRDIRLRVKRAGGEEHAVIIRPVSYEDLRKTARVNHLRDRAAKVADLSAGRLGYLQIESMDLENLRAFERGLYEEGYGKGGLVIDVRDNGGGDLTDRLLTILTQPRHAFTIRRGGARGYPHYSTVYKPWDKPIVVLCNQNSFSDAEVFCHAIKTIGRGKLVGVRTAGGVIGTDDEAIFDLGEIRMPSEGWYKINTGEDMELNGAKPDFEVWNAPGEIAAGKDRQLEKAVEVLLKEVADIRPLPKPVNAHADGR